MALRLLPHLLLLLLGLLHLPLLLLGLLKLLLLLAHDARAGLLLPLLVHHGH